MNRSAYKWGRNTRSARGWRGRGAVWDTFWSFISPKDQIPSPSSSPGCDNVCVQPCVLKRFGTFCLAWQHINLPELVPLSLFLSLSLSRKASQFFGDTSLVGVRISVGGHRSGGRGSDKLWNVKDQFLPHVSVLGEHCRAVSQHHV